MTQIIDGVMLLLSSTLAASILGKATLIATLGLVGAWLTRRSPAAVRHAVLAASLAVLLALPIASILIKPVRIALPASTQSGHCLLFSPRPWMPLNPLRQWMEASSSCLPHNDGEGFRRLPYCSRYGSRERRSSCFE
jgi:hypothetical protein